MLFGSGLCVVRMGVRDPEIDYEGCLRWMWWIDGDGCEMCGNVFMELILYQVIFHRIQCV